MPRDDALRLYDAEGNLLSITDPVNNETSYAYDSLGRQVSETNELSEVRQFAYDQIGNLVSTTDRNGRVTTYHYDRLDRVVGEGWIAAGEATFAIQSITRSGGAVTVTTTTAHGYSLNPVIQIAGADQVEYNGFFSITVTGTNTFTYSIGTATPATPATGSAMSARRTSHVMRFAYDAKGRTRRARQS